MWLLSEDEIIVHHVKLNCKDYFKNNLFSVLLLHLVNRRRVKLMSNIIYAGSNAFKTIIKNLSNNYTDVSNLDIRTVKVGNLEIKEVPYLEDDSVTANKRSYIALKDALVDARSNKQLLKCEDCREHKDDVELVEDPYNREMCDTHVEATLCTACYNGRVGDT